MIFCNLGSGSKGNSTYVQANGRGILIDQGFSQKNLEERMRRAGLEPHSIAALILTHEHTDHARGIGTTCRRYHIPVYITPNTFAALDPQIKLTSDQCCFFESGQTLRIENMAVKTFHTPHDAADPIGLRISYADQSLAVLTDLGSVTETLLKLLGEVHLLFLESNHDMFMLLNGPYPLYLIQRIKSRVGHLSNDQSLDLLSRLSHQTALRHLVLGHLSESNNDPEIVRCQFESARQRQDWSFQIEIASQSTPGPVIRL